VDADGGFRLMEAITLAKPDGELIMATFGKAKAG
jgi:hypothetical protein